MTFAEFEDLPYEEKLAIADWQFTSGEFKPADYGMDKSPIEPGMIPFDVPGEEKLLIAIYPVLPSGERITE
jgi:hypothetical protein